MSRKTASWRFPKYSATVRLETTGQPSTMAGLGTLCVNQILEDANADIDLYSPVEKLMELKTERENILIALVESQSEPAPVDAADGGRRVES